MRHRACYLAGDAFRFFQKAAHFSMAGPCVLEFLLSGGTSGLITCDASFSRRRWRYASMQAMPMLPRGAPGNTAMMPPQMMGFSR